jgi:hypothetical protein
MAITASNALLLDGGPPRSVANWDCETIRPNWSRDGKWIYFGANATQRYEIWKVPANQTDPPRSSAVRVTQNGGWEAAESVDGRRLFFMPARLSGDLWEMPAAGGEARRIIAKGVFHGWWSVSEPGIYYANFAGEGQPRTATADSIPILFHRFATGVSEVRVPSRNV